MLFPCLKLKIFNDPTVGKVFTIQILCIPDSIDKKSKLKKPIHLADRVLCMWQNKNVPMMNQNALIEKFPAIIFSFGGRRESGHSSAPLTVLMLPACSSLVTTPPTLSQ